MVQLFQRRVTDAHSQPLVDLEVNLKSLRLESPPPTSTPLAVQVLRFRFEKKEAAGFLQKKRFVYEIETCHQETGDIFRAERRFREFRSLRESLLLKCRECPDCQPFAENLKKWRLPARQMFVFNVDDYGASRVRELTHFLQDLVCLVAECAHHCARDGPDIDEAVGLFLGLSSFGEALDYMARSTTAMQIVPTKTRQDRIDIRAASMPDVRFSSSSLRFSDDSLQRVRSRGYFKFTSGLPTILKYTKRQGSW